MLTPAALAIPTDCRRSKPQLASFEFIPGTTFLSSQFTPIYAVLGYAAVRSCLPDSKLCLPAVPQHDPLHPCRHAATARASWNAASSGV